MTMLPAKLKMAAWIQNTYDREWHLELYQQRLWYLGVKVDHKVECATDFWIKNDAPDKRNGSYDACLYLQRQFDRLW